jgi:transposase-like protein
MLSYHPTAKTTYKIRKEIKENIENLTLEQQAKKYNVSISTIQKWRSREVFEDAAHGAINPKKSITDLEEYIICEIRKTTLLPLDDLLDIVNNFGIKITRSALDRALRRISNLQKYLVSLNTEEKPKDGEFKDYEIGYIHIDIKYLPKIEGNLREYLYVAIDRATRLVYVEILPDKTADSANIFLENVIEFFPFEIKKILTDNGKEFTDRFSNKDKKPTGNHIFDKTCNKNEIEHRLTEPYTPKTNGMVERMNGKVTENVLDKIRFKDKDELKQSIMKYIYNYNYHIKHSGINRKTPMESLEYWFNQKPELFKIDIKTFKESFANIYNYREGLDI